MRAKLIGQGIVLGFAIVWSLAASGDTITLADDYIVAPLDIATNTTLIVSPNFAATLDAPLTGSSTLTLQGGYINAASSMFTLANKDGNTFSGDIVVDTDGGWFTLAGNPYAPVGSQQGGMLPNMGAGNSITVKRGGYFYINDAVSTTLGYIANRLGSEGDRPAVTLQGGYFRLNGVNVAVTESEQTLGDLTIDVGPATVEVLRGNQITATPKLSFTSLSRNTGGTVNITGTSLGTAASGCAQILFGTPPTLDAGGLIGGWARSLNDWATYGTYGVTPVTSYGATIQGAAATDNIKITAVQTITGDNTINSLNWNFNGNLDLQTYVLTLVSGGCLKQNNNANSLLGTTGYVTAGAGDGAAAALTVYQNAASVLTWSALIKDNPAGSGNTVAFVVDGVGPVTLGQASDNDYSGGTFLNWGTLTTGTAANRRYLGKGPVRVGNGILVLGAIGATENTTFPDYTAVNGGQIQIPNVAMTEDTFTIAANSVINTVGTLGLNSLDRGMDGLSAVTNIVLDADAIIGHPALTTALNMDTGTIKNLGTAADIYYGLAANQALSAGSITVGTGTPFKGISTDRTARFWQLGAINVASGTSAINFRGLSVPGVVPVVLTVGNGPTYGGPVIALQEAGTVDVNIVGNVTLDDDAAIFGDTSAGKHVRFVVTPGATLTLNQAGALGSGTGVATVTVQSGGTLSVAGNPAGINGAVTIQAGGRLLANQVGGLIGTGALTLESGSIVDITVATGFSGAQAMAADFGDEVIVRMHANLGSPVASLYTFLKGKAPILETYLGNYWPVNPEIADTTVIRLRDGGTLVNDTATRSIAAVPNGKIAIGTNGAVIAATANTIFTIAQPLEMAANAVLTIGSSNAYDGIAPRLGQVKLTAANLYSTAAPGSSINVIPGATLSQSANALPQYVDVNVDGTFLMGGADTIGSLSGSGQIVQAANVLTVGRNQKSSTYSGAWAGTGAIYKSGTGRLDIASSVAGTGGMTVNNGILALSGDGTTLNTGAAGYTLIGQGIFALDNSVVNNNNRLTGALPGITFQGGTFRFLGKDGEAASESLGVATLTAGGVSTVDVVNGTGAGSSSEVTFSGMTLGAGTINFTSSGEGTLGAADDAPRVKFSGNMTAGKVNGFATVNGAPAYYDAANGIRAYTVGEGAEFDGAAVQTPLDTVFTAANTTPTLTLARTVNSLWIDSPGSSKYIDLGSSGLYHLTVASGRINLTGSDDFEILRSGTSTAGIVGAAKLYFDVDDAARTLTMSVPIASGAGTVSKEGEGTLLLNSASTFTGVLTVNEGTVKYALDNALATPALTIYSPGKFDIAGYSDTIGTATIYSGGITNSASGGELTVTALTMGSGSGPAGYAAYVDTGTGTLKLGGTVTFNAVNDPNTATIAGNLDLNGATRTFAVNDSVAEDAYVDMNIPAIISGGGGFGIAKTGAGTLRLGGDNTFNGPVSVTGTLRLSHPNALGIPSAARTLTVAAASTLAFDGENGDITVPANYTPVSLNGAGNTLIGILSGSLVNRSGTNTVQGPVTIAAATQLALLGGKLTLSGDITTTTLGVTLYGPGDSEFSGGYLGTTGSLTKNGGGTLTLSGSTDNTRTGITTINSGTILLNKAANTYAINSGAVTVNSGGILQYAASSANNNLINTAAVTLNGTGQLDFNGSTDTIGNLAVNATVGAAGDSVNLTNTAGGGTLTIGTLGITPVSGYLTTLDAGTGTLLLGGNVTFTLNGSGRAKISGNMDLGTATRTFTVGDGTHPEYDLLIDANISSASGAYGITKTTANSKLVLAGNNSYTGINTLSAGILRAQGHPNALGLSTAANAVALTTANILELAGDTDIAFGRNVTVSISNPRIVSDRVTPGPGTTHTMGGLMIGAFTLNIDGGANVTGGVAAVAFTNVTMTGAATFTVTTPTAGGTTRLTLGNVDHGANLLTVRGVGDTLITGTLGSGSTKSGGLTKLDTGTLTLAGPGLYTGTTLISAGVVMLAHHQAAANSLVDNRTPNGLGFGVGTDFTIGGLMGAEAISLTNAAGEGVTLTVGANNANATYPGLLSGSGGIAKIGTATQTLANVTLVQYEGDTTVSNGVLQINTNFLPATGDVVLNAPGKLFLNFRAVNAVRYLYVDGAKCFAGVYGSNNLPDHITGPGVLLVESAPELLCWVQADKVMGDPSEFFTFSGLYSGNNTNITSYAWDFDDNGSIESNTATASRQFPASGVYKVRLTVVNELLETATYLWTGSIFLYPHNTRTWSGAGANALASNPANWVGGVAPVPGDHIILDAAGSAKPMTCDLNIPVQTWTQVGYAGTVTIATVYGTTGFTNFSILGDCVISNGVWTHAINTATPANRLNVRIGGELTLGPNASIDVSNKGYPVKNGPGYIPPGDNAASHGGYGWGGGPCYGSVVTPTHVGSGGRESAGGGAILMTVGRTIRHDGLIAADGGPTSWGGGSGGSIWMTAGDLVGTGTIRANGAIATSDRNRAAAGGRIALVVIHAGTDFSGFLGTHTAYSTGGGGRAGTIYREKPADGPGKGELIIDNAGGGGIGYGVYNTDLSGLEAVTYEFSRIILTNGGVLNIGSDDTLIASNTVFIGQSALTNGIWISGGTLLAPPTFAYSNLFIGISGSGSTFSPSTLLTIPTNGIFQVNQPHAMTCDVTIQPGGLLSHTPNPAGNTESYKIELTLDGSLTVESGGSVDVTGRGFPVNYGTGTPLVGSVGASYGGLGVGGLSCYGSLVAPTNLGSGGRSSGAGGGAIRLAVSGVVSNGGGILANAAMVTANTGAGGSIFITAGALTGTGPIQANSATNVTGANPGGGGRVAVAVTNVGENIFSYAGVITANGGRKPAGTSGGAGTVYLRSAGEGLFDGTLVVDNDNLNGLGTEISSSVTDTTVANVLIQRSGNLLLNTNQTLTVSGVWSNMTGFTGLTDAAVIFGGAANSTSTVYGSTTFMGLSCVQPGKTLQFEAESINAVAAYGRLILRGDAATNLILRSTVPGTAWYLNTDALAEQDIEFVDVTDSDAAGGAEIIAKNSAGADQDNVNWSFLNVTPGETIVWTGNDNTLWTGVGNWDRPRAPAETDVIVIPSGRPYYPVFDAARTMNRLEIQAGGSVALNGYDLTVTNAAVIAGALGAAGTETLTLLKDADFTGGVFAPAFSTITLAGAADQSVNLAGLTFYKVRVDNGAAAVTLAGGFTATELRCEASSGARSLVFESGKTVALRDLVLRSAVGTTNITLNSTTGGASWKLAVSGYRSVHGVDVQDSDASVGLPIPALASEDGGGNTNWTFGVAPTLWLGTSGNNFHTAASWDPAVVPDASTRVLVEGVNPMTLTGTVSILDLTVGGGVDAASVTINGTMTVGESVTVLDKGTLTWNRPGVVSNDLIVASGGLLTHSANSSTEANKLDLTVLGDVEIDDSGSIDVTAKGYGVKLGPGRPPTNAVGTVTDGAGSYGGLAWAGGPCYGSILAPTNIGSGGRDCAGGGAIRLAVQGTIRNDGLVTADGQVAAYGGGAGGSIWMISGKLTGVGETRADAGRANDYYRSGGGGRISLVVTNAGADFSMYAVDRITVFGGKQSIYGTASGGSGTIYFQTAFDRVGRGLVRITNNNHTGVPYTDVPAFMNGVAGEADRAIFRLVDGSTLRLTAGFTVGDIWLDTANAWLDLGSNTLTVNAREHPLGLVENVLNPGTIVWTGLPPGVLIIVK